ncbi:MAG: diguanylate cyclase, partial [Planctomycetales bacterium]|nr:diguanylate cyclase [Planctomycetales bacterium]
ASMSGWSGFLTSKPVLATVFVSAVCGVVFLIYMDRTLQYLDPTQAVPGRVRSALNTLAEGLIVLDKDNRIVLANNAFGEQLGIESDSLIGHTADSVHGFRRKSNEALPWETSQKSGKAELGARVHLIDAEKREKTFLVNASPVVDDAGVHQGVLASFDDITVLEEKETRLQKMLTSIRQSREHIKRQNEELRVLATVDPLTGCYNRRTFLTRFDEMFNESKQRKTPLHCLMVDIDFFKSINDDYGHSAGDETLRVVAGVLNDHVRDNDMACRYGGEEFCLLLPGRSHDAMEKEAERLRIAIENAEVTGFPILIKVTASLGLASIYDGAGDPQELQDQADKSLYVAKRNGRNQVVQFGTWSEEIDFEETISREKSGGETVNLPTTQIPYPAVTSLLSALAFRDPETAAHSKRVSELSVEVARGLLSSREIYLLEIAALLHDIGKIGVPDSILLKPGALTEEEWNVMETYRRISVEIIESAFSAPELSEIVSLHHKRLSEAAIPASRRDSTVKAAKIIELVDAFDSMVSDHVYRSRMTSDEAFAELRQCAGKQFDPQLVERLIAIARIRRPSNSVDISSKEAALQIGIQVEELMTALDDNDISRLHSLATRLQATAEGYSIPAIQEMTAELIAASEGDAESHSLETITEQLIDLCRSTRAMYVEVRGHHEEQSAS